MWRGCRVGFFEHVGQNWRQQREVDDVSIRMGCIGDSIKNNGIANLTAFVFVSIVTIIIIVIVKTVRSSIITILIVRIVSSIIISIIIVEVTTMVTADIAIKVIRPPSFYLLD